MRDALAKMRGKRQNGGFPERLSLPLLERSKGVSARIQHTKGRQLFLKILKKNKAKNAGRSRTNAGKKAK